MSIKNTAKKIGQTGVTVFSGVLCIPLAIGMHYIGLYKDSMEIIEHTGKEIKRVWTNEEPETN